LGGKRWIIFCNEATNREGQNNQVHYLLFYEVGEDYTARRAQFREAHLEKAWKASARGELLLGGALANPVDGAILLFQGDSSAVAENFAKADPYVMSGLVRRWHVREWTTVAGEGAAMPVKPKGGPGDNRSLSQTSSPKPAGKDAGTILRMWRARSTAEKESGYVHLATQRVFPHLCEIEGHRGAYLLRRVVAGAVELVVLTFWESMDAVRRFAGAEPDRAVVEPEARATLTEFDDMVTHFEVVYSAPNE
jgi:uncharacterized protein